MGTAIKIREYLVAFHLDILTDIAPWLAVLLCGMELLLGLMLLFGLFKKITAYITLLFMCFFTLLTFYILIASPVSDCGCFGDAIVLDNWTTFYKNIVLLALAIWLVATQRYAKTWFVNWVEWTGMAFFCLVSIVISIVCLCHLPFMDFRPYKVGTDIEKSMEIPEGAPADEYHITFIYEKDGHRQEFTLENYPKDDSTWTFVDQKSVLVKQGYVPPIHDFSITDANFDDITYDVLDYEGYTILAIMYDLEKTNIKQAQRLNQLYTDAQQKGYMFYALTGSESTIVDEFVEQTGAEYPFCGTDPITLKTIVRANPGIVLLKDGVIVGKWNMRDVKNDKIFR